MTLIRTFRLYWTRYLFPFPMERDPDFRKSMDALTRRGLRVAGTLGVIGIVAYMLAHLLFGRQFVWSFSEVDSTVHVVLWNKVLITVLSIAALALARIRPRVRPGRMLMSLILVVASLSIILEDVASGDFTFTAGWLTLLMLLTVGTVPFQPWQTGLTCLLIATLYGLYAEASAATITAHSAGVPESRLVYLGLVTFLCTSMSASLYVSRYEQYRAFRTVDRLKANLSARSEALQRAVTRSKQMQDKLVQQEKLASLGQLTAGIAHEIKNPLNFVNNFAHLSLELVNELDEDLSSNPDRPVREALSEVGDVLADLRTNTHKIAEHGQRADGIVKSMLAHSRTTPGDRRAVSLHKLLDEYVNLAYHGMRAQHRDFNVEIQREYDQSIGEIDLVPEEMGRVILNLLDNAFDAVRLVSREENGFNPIVTVTTKASENGAVIMISDNGRGIPEELRERIFEPFFTTKPSGEGTGLGLSLAYEIVTAGHGGSMDVRTSTSGTTFTVELPEDAEQSEDADEEIDT